MGKDGADGDELRMVEWASKDLIPRWQWLKRDRGSLQKGDKHGIRAQNRNMSRSYAVYNRSLARQGFGSYHQTSSEEGPGLLGACALAQAPQWEEDPC